MEPSASKRWVLVAGVVAVVGFVAGAWLLEQFRQPQPGIEFERLDQPPEEHFVLNQSTYEQLAPAVREAIRDAVETGRAGTSLPSDDYRATGDILQGASQDQTGERYVREFEYEGTYLRYERATP